MLIRLARSEVLRLESGYLVTDSYFVPQLPSSMSQAFINDFMRVALVKKVKKKPPGIPRGLVFYISRKVTSFCE